MSKLRRLIFGGGDNPMRFGLRFAIDVPHQVRIFISRGRSETALFCMIRLYLESYSLHSGTQRVIGYLLRAEPEPDAAGNIAQLKLPTSKGIIASRLNLTPEHFSRVLHELTAAGLITVDGRTVIILDLERLRTYEG